MRLVALYNQIAFTQCFFIFCLNNAVTCLLTVFRAIKQQSCDKLYTFSEMFYNVHLLNSTVGYCTLTRQRSQNGNIDLKTCTALHRPLFLIFLDIALANKKFVALMQSLVLG